MGHLRVLVLEHNELECLPDQFRSSTLEVLELHHNRLRRLPSLIFQALPRLRILNVAQNQLKSLPLPPPLPDQSRLTHLTAAANSLTDDSLPTVFGT